MDLQGKCVLLGVTGGIAAYKMANVASALKKLGADAVYFCPVFESDAHGYDTRDYTRIDGRLGTNGEFAALCRTLHESGIRVVLDGMFNHVGRGFWAFRDVQEKRWDSPYKDWFHISFDGKAFEYSLEQLAADAGKSKDEVVASLDLLDVDEIAAVLPKLNISKLVPDASKLYLTSKLPFAFNYVDENFDITHDNDKQGEHGSHVAGIAAANRYQ